jgi:signal transduction histidine kinase
MSSGLLERLRPTLGFRVALWYAALFVAGSSGLFVLSYVLLDASLEQRDHDAIVTTLAAYVADYESGGLPALRRTFATAQEMGTQADLFVRVLGHAEIAVFLNLPARWGSFDLSRLPAAPPPGERRWSRLSTGGGGPVLEVASVRLADGTILEVGRSTAARDELLERFRVVLATVFAAMLVVGLLGGAVLTHAALRPLRELSAAARSIVETGRLDARVPARGSSDPLDALGALFNSMLERISALMAGMRESLDNVAHDLRTPVMRLRAISEAVLHSGGDAAAYREALADGLEQAEQVVALLEALMDISEAEAGAMRLNLEPVAVAPLLRSAVELYADLAEEKGITVEVACPEELTVTADRSRLRQVLANLLDNALKYTPRGGRVDLGARAEGGGVRIEVRDTGMGIPPEELPRVWDRLYRGDVSRTERGLGLGLSLVKAIMNAHQGQVGVESTPGRGSCFSLRLPAAPPAPDLTRL